MDTKLSLIDESTVMKKWVSERMEELQEEIVERAS
jgi:hypothetical protein